METLLEEATSLLKLSPPALLIVLLMGIGKCVKSANIRGIWIPPILMVIGGAAYPCLVDVTKLEYEASVRPIFWGIAHGMALGLASTGVHQIYFNAMEFISSKKKDTDTKLFSKSKPK